MLRLNERENPVWKGMNGSRIVADFYHVGSSMIIDGHLDLNKFDVRLNDLGEGRIRYSSIRYSKLVTFSLNSFRLHDGVFEGKVNYTDPEGFRKILDSISAERFSVTRIFSEVVSSVVEGLDGLSSVPRGVSLKPRRMLAINNVLSDLRFLRYKISESTFGEVPVLRKTAMH